MRDSSTCKSLFELLEHGFNDWIKMLHTSILTKHTFNETSESLHQHLELFLGAGTCLTMHAHHKFELMLQSCQ